MEKQRLAIGKRRKSIGKKEGKHMEKQRLTIGKRRESIWKSID